MSTPDAAPQPEGRVSRTEGSVPAFQIDLMSIVSIALILLLCGALWQVYSAFKSDLIEPLIDIIVGPLWYRVTVRGSTLLIGDFVREVLVTAIALGLFGLIMGFLFKNIPLRVVRAFNGGIRHLERYKIQ